MPVNEKGCDVLAQWYKTASITHNKILEILALISKVLTLKIDIKWGNFLDVVVADLINAIAAVSNKIAADVAGGVSNMAAALIEQVFSSILKILLASPKAIFSLVAIPHEAAKEAAHRERRYLNLAQGNLNVIRGVISKWEKGFSGSEYYDKITQAQPYVTRAINAAKQMIDDLNTTDQKDGFPPNAVFNKSLYGRLQSNLQSAIDITQPESAIEKKLEINKRIERRQEEIYNEKASSIITEDKRRRDNVADEYAQRMQGIGASDKGTPSIKQATEQEAAKIWYREQITFLDNLKKENLAKAQIKSKAESLYEWQRWIGDDIDISPFDAFSQDMKIIGNELYEFLGNVKDAYTKNVECQLYCNNIWNIRTIIRTLINEVIDYLRKAGNLSSKVAYGALKAALPTMQVTYDLFQDVIDDRNQSKRVSSTEMASKLAMGNAALITADMLLDGGITDSLIKTINADDVLLSENIELNEFLYRMREIRDWDGKKGVWSVDMQKGATTPYIQLIADASTMLTLLPGLSISGNDDDKARARVLVKNTSLVFKKLKNHNAEVSNTLESYTPYMNEDASALQRILAAAGMLQSFAMGMSLVSLVSDVMADFGSMILNTDTVNYENCKKEYPDKFNDPNVALYAAISRRSFPSKEFYPKVQESAEKNESNVLKAKQSLNTYDINAKAKTGNLRGKNPEK